MAFFLAMDVGGTKTDYVLADEKQELARVRTGTIKRMRIDAPSAKSNLEEALTKLTTRSGVSMNSILRTCVGTAGATVPLVADWLRESISARVSGDLILLGDVEIALDAAFHNGKGVLVMAGTGSNVAGRTSDGTLFTVGGWGPALADQGSGHRIGLEALRAAFLARDEGKPALLLEAVRAFWHLDSLDSLVAYANTSPPPDFSALTEVVLFCSDQGDPVAASVLRKEAEDLAWLVRLLLRRMQSAETSTGPATLPTIACTGSILENVKPVRQALIQALRSEFPTMDVLEGVVDPIAGALWRARTGR